MRNLIYRVITSVMLLPIVIGAFILGGIFLNGLLGLVGLLCCFEVAKIIHPHSRPARIMAMVFAIGLMLAFFCAPTWPTAVGYLFGTTLIFNAYVLFSPALLASELERLSAIFFWCLYVVFAIACLSWLARAPMGFDERTGLSFVLLACMATWFNDTFAYFGGRLLGTHQLFPSVSAKKTWEGFVSGALFSVASILALAYGSAFFGVEIFSGLSLADLLWVLLPSCMLAPMGDLIESRLKRLYDTKDSSNILPGHGGLLDRVDGLLTVVPWTALYAFIIRPI